MEENTSAHEKLSSLPIMGIKKRFELPHVKTNKMTVHPAKTQISLDNCLVFAVRSVGN